MEREPKRCDWKKKRREHKATCKYCYREMKKTEKYVSLSMVAYAVLFVIGAIIGFIPQSVAVMWVCALLGMYIVFALAFMLSHHDYEGE